MPIARSAFAGRVAVRPPAPPAPVTGLIFPSNNVAGSDIGLDWAGANLLPRVGHTAIWKANFVQQAGYYAVAWHVHTDNTWSATDEFGTHPYPATGTVDGTGAATGGTGSGGTVHYHEVAGLNALDFIASAGGSPLLVQKGVWLTQARKAEFVTVSTANDTVRQTYWPDLDGNPSFSIVQDYPASSVTGTFKFRFGASPWTATGSANAETPSGTLRFFLLYDRAMSLAEVQAKSALTADDTTDANVWYSNINPTVADVADKSGQGHNPSWANANRPTLYTG